MWKRWVTDLEKEALDDFTESNLQWAEQLRRTLLKELAMLRQLSEESLPPTVLGGYGFELEGDEPEARILRVLINRIERQLLRFRRMEKLLKPLLDPSSD